jgi:hypothetical protein
MARLRFGLASFSLATMAAQASPAYTCTIRSEIYQQAGESDEAFEVRRKADAAERNKTPEQRELEHQAWLWDNSHIVFIGQIEALRVNGKIYPRPKGQQIYLDKRGKVLPPPPDEPLVILPFEGGGEVQIRSVRLLKGETDFKTRWHFVGGMDTCGGRPGGALGFVRPKDELIIFARWQDLYQVISGKEVTSKYLDLYGVNFDAVTEQRLLAALSGSNQNESVPR